MATPATAEPAVRGAMAPAAFRVVDRTRETADTWTLRLAATRGETPQIAPGQFMMVYVLGVGEAPISVSDPADPDGLLHLTVRAVGQVTDAVCAARPGETLGLRGPFGNAWPVEAAAGGDVLVVAGGIGLAPLRPVVLRMLAERDAYEGVVVLYGARTPADLLYRDELVRWADRLDVAVTVDAADGTWGGRVGVVPKLVGEARFHPERTTAFVCGPEIMMSFTVDALLVRGVPPARIALSLERDMRCGIGLCGHCQLGPTLICRDGPVYSFAELAPWLEVREL